MKRIISILVFLGLISGNASAQATVTASPFYGPFCANSGQVFFAAFSSSTCGNPTSIEWDFGDGTTLTGSQFPSHTYAASGTYTATVIADWPCSIPDTSTVIISLDGLIQSLSLGGEFSQSDSVCFDGNTSFSAQLTIGFQTGVDSITFNWDDGSGSTLTSWGSPINQSHSYTSPGIYDIEVITHSLDPCFQDTITRTVSVFAEPIASFSFSGGVCAGASVNFTDLSSGTISNWLWNFGGSGTSTFQNPSHVFNVPGDIPVELTVTGAGGCESSSINQITISNGPNQVDFTESAGCPCNEVTFTASGANVSYDWSFGDGTSSSSISPTHVFNTPGNFLVSVAAVDASGCRTRMNREIEVCSGDILHGQSLSNENWQLYDDAALDFGTAPSVVSGPSNQLNPGTYPAREAIATMSDHNTGALLFYSNGEEVWDASLSTMQNGSGLKGNNSSAEGALIIPFPGDTNRYYLIVNSGSTIGGPANQVDSVWYNVIDMSLNGGLGGVVPGQKNILLVATEGSEATSAAIRRLKTECDDASYWLVVSPDSYVHNVYAITNTGIALSTSQQFPNVPSGAGSNFSRSCFSPSQTRFAAIGPADGILLYDFDKTTGTLSNQQFIAGPTGIPSYSGLRAITFSPDNTKLYAAIETTGSNTKYIAQYDVQTNDIKSSEFLQTAGTSLINSFATGEDGNIYFTRNFNSRLGVINDPNVSGAGNNLVVNGKNLLGAASGNGLQNIIKLWTPRTQDMSPAFTADSTNCLTYSFTNSSLLPNYTDACSFLANNDVITPTWDFGDGSSSSQDSPSHTYSTDGTYDVSLILTRPFNCEADTLQQTIIVNQCSVLPVELVHFTGKESDQGIDLTWKTQSEEHSSHFVLERLDESGDVLIEQVAAQGYTQTESIYAVTDLRPRTGVNYYRLTAFDLDGTVSYDGTISVTKQAESILIYPNPAKENLKIEFTRTGTKQVQVLTSDGKKLKEEISESIQMTLDINDLPAGIYILKINEADKSKTQFFVKSS